MKTVNELIKDINSLTSHLHEKDFLLTWEQTPDELKQVLDVAAALKALRAENISTKVFNSGLGISVFRDLHPYPLLLCFRVEVAEYGNT